MSDPRRKPIYRPRNIILLVLLVLAGWLGFAVLRAWNMRPNIAVDYVAELRALADRSQEPGPDAWPAMSKLFALRDSVEQEVGPQFPEELEDFDGTLRYDRVCSAPWGESAMEPELLALRLQRERGMEDILKEIVSSPRAQMPIEGDASSELMRIMLPELGASRSTARMLAADAYAAARAGEFDRYALSIESILAIAKHTGSQPILVSGLVGMATVSLACKRIGEDVIEMELPERTCLALMAALDRWRLPGLEVPLEGERMMFLDIVQRVYTDDGNGDGRLILSKFDALTLTLDGPASDVASTMGRIANLASAFFPSRTEVTEKYNSFINHLTARSKLPRWERASYPVDTDAFVSSLPQRWVLIRLLTPALSRTVESYDRIDAQRQATRLMLALEIYEARHGELPESLEALWPEILPEPVIDPINGKGFGYVRREPTEDDPRKYLVYSFGLDGTDDGGREYEGEGSEGGPLRNPSLKGYDYVFSTLRSVWVDP